MPKSKYISQIASDGPPGPVNPPEVPNPIRALQTLHSVPLGYLARYLGVGRDHLQRQRDGKAVVTRQLELALEAVDYRWQQFGHGYVHPNKIHPTRRRKN